MQCSRLFNVNRHFAALQRIRTHKPRLKCTAGIKVYISFIVVCQSAWKVREHVHQRYCKGFSGHTWDYIQQVSLHSFQQVSRVKEGAWLRNWPAGGAKQEFHGPDVKTVSGILEPTNYWKWFNVFNLSGIWLNSLGGLQKRILGNQTRCVPLVQPSCFQQALCHLGLRTGYLLTGVFFCAWWGFIDTVKHIKPFKKGF